MRNIEIYGVYNYSGEGGGKGVCVHCVRWFGA